MQGARHERGSLTEISSFIKLVGMKTLDMTHSAHAARTATDRVLNLVLLYSEEAPDTLQPYRVCNRTTTHESRPLPRAPCQGSGRAYVMRSASTQQLALKNSSSLT